MAIINEKKSWDIIPIPMVMQPRISATAPHVSCWMDNSKARAISSDFSANTKTQLALIDFQLEKFRASAIMVLHSQ